MSEIPFTKMVGTGNDFVLVDGVRNRLSKYSQDWPTIARAVCDRHRGIGADGILLLEPSSKADLRMRILNADGSEAEMCGNGTRCVARFVQSLPGRKNGKLSIETLAGILEARVEGPRITVRMTEPKDLRQQMQVDLNGRRIQGGFVNTGVPHFVVPVEDIETVDVPNLGRALRTHPDFGPKGTNVNFIQPVQKPSQRLRVRTYERGVEGETLACGTGMTAAAILYGLQQPSKSDARRVTVQPASGDLLTISFRAEKKGNAVHVSEVDMEGEARSVFAGTFTWPPVEGDAA